MIEVDLDFVFFSAGIFISLPIFWWILAQKPRPAESDLAAGNVLPEAKISTMIVLGSGGHTTEILRLTSALNPSIYQPRTFVVADTDQRSEERLRLSSEGKSCRRRWQLLTCYVRTFVVAQLGCETGLPDGLFSNQKSQFG
jgi:hypothetical protein